MRLAIQLIAVWLCLIATHALAQETFDRWTAPAEAKPLPLALGGRLFPRIPRHTQRFKDLYRGRAAIEREFGRLKHDYGLAPLRVRGLEKVALHADLTMLARLSQALSRAREAMPVAA